MTEYRYHRLAPNNNAWLRPHLGRFTGNSEGDYVAQHGFGLEDWNFAKDIWQDGKIHLYLRQPPAESARDQVFSIVLGDYRDGQHFISGFAEQVRYQTSTLSAETLDRRASELMGLQERDQLGGKFSEMSKDELIKALGDEADLIGQRCDQNICLFRMNRFLCRSGSAKSRAGDIHCFAFSPRIMRR